MMKLKINKEAKNFAVELETSMINDDYNTKDFSVGSVVRLKHDGATFVAETNVSPWTIYANPKTIEVW